MNRLAGKRAIVTGAAQGQGAAIARAFVEEGAQVVIADIAEEAGRRWPTSCARSGRTRRTSAGTTSATRRPGRRWSRTPTSASGPVNVLVNNAGILRFGEVEKMEVEEFELLFRVNQLGCFLGMKSVARTMRKNGGGSIINASSIEGLGGMAFCTAYAATKFAIRGMTKSAAMELGPKGIRVNSVHPGMIDTPMTRIHGGDDGDGVRRRQGRPQAGGPPRDVAPAYVYLASDESSFVTGAELAIDGGATATHAFGGVDPADRAPVAESLVDRRTSGRNGSRSQDATSAISLAAARHSSAMGRRSGRASAGPGLAVGSAEDEADGGREVLGDLFGGGAAGDPGDQGGQPDVADHAGDGDLVVGGLGALDVLRRPGGRG